MRSAAAVAATGLALVAASAAPADEPEPVPTRDCRTRIEPTRGHFRFVEPNDLVVGPVSLFGARRANPRVGRRPDGRFFLKVPVKVLWGPPATVSVVEPNTGAVALEYVRSFGLAPSVRFVGCAPGTPMWSGLRHRRVTGFSGGFTFARRGCYRLEVRVEGRVAVHRGRVPLGAPCR